MDRLHGVLVYLSVFETRRFSETARGLGVSTSAVSAAVQRLEQKLGVRLLNRTTRRVVPTAEGLEFYQRCKQIIADLEQAEIAVSGSGRLPSGRLRIGMPSALGRIWVVPNLTEFAQAFPSISLEIITGDFFTASDREGLDAVIHIGDLPPSRRLVRKLASVDYVLCAAPSYVAQHGRPKNIADLKDHICLSYRRPRNGQIRQWRFARGPAVDIVKPSDDLIFNSGDTLTSAAVAGLGIVQVSELYARRDLDSGMLMELLPELRSIAYDVSIVSQQRKAITPRLRVFIDFLVDLFSPPPWHEAQEYLLVGTSRMIRKTSKRTPTQI